LISSFGDNSRLNSGVDMEKVIKNTAGVAYFGECCSVMASFE